MTRSKHILSLVALLVALLALPAEAGRGYETVKGEVVAVQQQTSNQGVDQMVTVRTRTGERKQFRLGDPDNCSGCVRVGDQVRARVSSGPGDRSGRVQKMKVHRNGEMFGYSNQSGRLVRTRQRLKDGSGGGRQAGVRNRDGGSGSGRGHAGAGSGSRGGSGGQGGRGSGGGRG